MSLLFLALTTGTALAENSLSLSAERTELGPQEQVLVTVQALDENQVPLSGEMQVLIRISRGGLLDSKILKEGLILKDGVGEFIYIAPTKRGNADILMIDPNTNISARLTFNVLDEPVETVWKKEFARITKIKGRVAYQAAGEETWNSALKDIELQEGDSIRTWEKSWVTLELFDGSEITLEPWTTLYIKFLQSSLANAELKQSVFKVYTGNVLCKVKKYVEKGSRFEIETESTAAGIRGTVFEIQQSLQGDTELTVYEGSVVFESLPHETLFVVDNGQRITLSEVFEIPDVQEHNITPEEREQAILEEQNAAEAEEMDEEPQPADEEVDETSAEEGDSVDEEDSSAGNSSDEWATPAEPEEIADPIVMPVTDDSSFTDITQPAQPEPGSQPNLIATLLQTLMPDKTSMNFGSQATNEKVYFVFSVRPEFMNILGSGFSIGLNLALYQDPISGEVRIGSPDEGVILSNVINWLEYDGKYTYLRYGYLENITYGFGMLMGNYSKEGARGIQLGLDNISPLRLGCRVLLPLDIKSFYPWYMEETSSLYAARVTSKMRLLGILPLQVGASVVTDTNLNLKLIAYDVPDLGIGVDVSLPGVTLVEPFAEIAHLNNFGYGAEAGIRGSLFNTFWYQTGFRGMSASFVPNYFGGDYEELKRNSLIYLTAPAEVSGRQLPDLYNAEIYADTSGAYFQAGANLGLASLKLGYENYSGREEYSPILYADFVAQTPHILNLPRLSCGLNYRQLQFNKYEGGLDPFFNKNTNFVWYVSLPITSDLSLSFVSRFIPSDTEIRYTKELNISVPF